MNRSSETFLYIVNNVNNIENIENECKELIDIIKTSDLEIGGIRKIFNDNAAAMSLIRKLFMQAVHNYSLLDGIYVSEKNQDAVRLSRELAKKIDIANMKDLTKVYGYGSMFGWCEDHPDFEEAFTGFVLRSSHTVQQNWLRILIRLLENDEFFKSVALKDMFLPYI